MDALEILGQMHVEAKDAFQKIGAALPQDRDRLWQKLAPELKLHEQLEERFVYEPVMRDAGDRDPVLRDWDHKHRADVNAAEQLIHQIGELSPTESHWLQTVEKLHGALEEHIRTEEAEIWPRIRSVWDASRLRTAGTEIKAAKAAGAVVSTVKSAMGSVSDSVTGAADHMTGKNRRGSHAA